MPTSSIAQILIRIFALSWIIRGLVPLLTVFFLGSDFFGAIPLYASLPYIIASVMFWWLAPGLSRLIAKGYDQGIPSLKGVTERQLFSTAFVSIGAYFVLSSVGKVFSWAHFFIIYQLPAYGFHRESQPSYYDLMENILTLVAGAALIGTARIWAAKLTREPRSKVQAEDQES